MPFDISTWKAQLSAKLPGWRVRMQAGGVNSAYYFIAASAFLPIVQALQGGIIEPFGFATVASGLGTNLLANIVQNWRDEASAAATLQEAAAQDTELPQKLDALLTQLEAFALAEQHLATEDRAWFAAIIKQELAELKSSVHYETKVIGDGVIVLGDGAKGVGKNGIMVNGNVGGSVVTGSHNILLQVPPKGASPQALRAAYLSQLFESASPLALAGVDRKTASETEARLSLSAVYTALLTRSGDEQTGMKAGRAEMPERLVERGETHHLSALEQLNRHNRLVLLGDPGSGKSTFVNFVALCLAGESLGSAEVNVKLLTAPIPPQSDERSSSRDEKPVPQPWEHGALLPVRIILRDFAARGLPPVGQKASAEHLWKFIVAELTAAALGAFAQPLSKELLERGGLILFDGLDEVPEAEQRREQIRQALDEFASVFGKCRFLVTSRTYAYQKQDWKLRGFQETVLAPFTQGQIARFVDGWYAHIAIVRKMDSADAHGKAELLKRAITNSDRLMSLAERPLLLTLMASLHAWRGGTLPEKREELYADTVDLLLDWWESQRVVRDGRGQAVNIQPSLAEWLKVDRQKVRDLLNQLAYEAHIKQNDLSGTADVPENELLAGLMRLSQNPDVKPARLLEYLRDRAGLLLPRGVGVYTFPHRTFQEYLAACYLTDHGYPEDVARFCRVDPNRWREVTLLAGAKAARGGAFALWPLVDALSPESDQCGNAACAWGAQIAGQAIQEIADLQKVGEANLPKVARIRARLLDILEGERLPALERARAGDTLAALGDPRPEVLTCERMAFCHVPAGDFIFGEGKEQKKVNLPDEFWIGKYPVTNAQFAQFVVADGYAEARFWEEAKKAKIWRNGKIHLEWAKEIREAPADFGEPFNLPNHPIVGITWYEALAFTRWLSEQLSPDGDFAVNAGESVFREQLKAGKLKVDLPGEEQWEKAARGTDGRKYPWAGDFDPNKANTTETGIGTTTAVGVFPGGQSPYGLLDASGNVWEWTASPYDKSNYVLRGGAFNFNVDLARCAYRRGSAPDYGLRNLGFRVCVVVFSRASL